MFSVSSLNNPFANMWDVKRHQREEALNRSQHVSNLCLISGLETVMNAESWFWKNKKHRLRETFYLFFQDTNLTLWGNEQEITMGLDYKQKHAKIEIHKIHGTSPRNQEGPSGQIKSTAHRGSAQQAEPVVFPAVLARPWKKPWKLRHCQQCLWTSDTGDKLKKKNKNKDHYGCKKHLVNRDAAPWPHPQTRLILRKIDRNCFSLSWDEKRCYSNFLELCAILLLLCGLHLYRPS